MSAPSAATEKATTAATTPAAPAPAVTPAPKAAPAAPAATPAPVSPVAASVPSAPASISKTEVKAAPVKEEGEKAPASKAAALAGTKAPAAASSVVAPSATPGSATAAGSAGVPTAAPTVSSTKAAAPTSAAAVVIPGQKPVTAIDRAAATGSVLSSGVGAKAEAPAPKAKAKAAAAPSAGYVPTAAKVPTTSGSGPATYGPAPSSVLEIVTGKPSPALEGGLTAGGAGSVGPARAFAATAEPLLPKGVEKASEVPKVGPAAVAVGRAVAAGLSPAVTTGKGKPRTAIAKKYQIVFVTSEVAPYSKTGGLGEAMDGLPIALAALGHRVMVVTPRYDQYADAWDTGYWSEVTMGGKQEKVHFFHCYKQKVDQVFVDHPTFLERVDGLSGSKLYGPEWGKDFSDNQARFAYFCKATLKAISELSLGGATYGDKTIVVANDWHSALVPMYIHAERSANPTKWANTKTCLLCHNAVFQGRFEREEGIAEVLGVPQSYIDSITFKMPLRVGRLNPLVSCVNTMAAGLRYCDRALTVSPTYAEECATDPEKGVELEKFFAMAKVTGILNGVKEGVSPLEANFVTKTKMTCGTFDATTADVAKAELKAAYLAENGLPASTGPLMCFIGRLDAQKGYDLLLEALIEVLEDTPMTVVIVGAGREDLVKETRAVEKKFAGKFFYAGWMGPERYALLAGCDYTLLPSRWEPCGLVQMEAMRVGTLPIVAPTGGLKDTVADGVNGIWTDSLMTMEAELEAQSIESIAKALRRAANLYINEPEKVSTMKKAAMAAAAEFTWSNAALQYEAIFEELGAIDVLPRSADKTVTLEADKQVC